jgi:hypothetical protein
MRPHTVSFFLFPFSRLLFLFFCPYTANNERIHQEKNVRSRRTAAQLPGARRLGEHVPPPPPDVGPHDLRAVPEHRTASGPTYASPSSSLTHRSSLGYPWGPG